MIGLMVPSAFSEPISVELPSKTSWIFNDFTIIAIIIMVVFVAFTISKKFSSNKKKSRFNNKKQPRSFSSGERQPIPAAWRHEIFERDGFKCLDCGNGPPNVVLHIDHIQPVSKGGLTEKRNLQTLCSECNMAKFNREWPGGK